MKSRSDAHASCYAGLLYQQWAPEAREQAVLVRVQRLRDQLRPRDDDRAVLRADQRGDPDHLVSFREVEQARRASEGPRARRWVRHARPVTYFMCALFQT